MQGLHLHLHSLHLLLQKTMRMRTGWISHWVRWNGLQKKLPANITGMFISAAVKSKRAWQFFGNFWNGHENHSRQKHRKPAVADKTGCLPEIVWFFWCCKISNRKIRNHFRGSAEKNRRRRIYSYSEGNPTIKDKINEIVFDAVIIPMLNGFAKRLHLSFFQKEGYIKITKSW